jgi:hypothetical protein
MPAGATASAAASSNGKTPAKRPGSFVQLWVGPSGFDTDPALRAGVRLNQRRGSTSGNYFLPWFFTASMAAAAASGSR